MIRLLKIIQTALIVVMLTVAVASGIFVAGSARSWWKADVVLSGSMEPTMPVGSLVFATEKPTGSLAVGDILMFVAPIDGHPKIMHRVVSVRERSDGAVAVQTKGDNNKVKDYWTLKISSPTSMVVAHHLPYLGYLVHRPIFVGLITGGLILLLSALGFLQSALEADEKDTEPARRTRTTA